MWTLQRTVVDLSGVLGVMVLQVDTLGTVYPRTSVDRLSETSRVCGILYSFVVVCVSETRVFKSFLRGSASRLQ